MADLKGRSPQDGNPNGLLYASAKERMQESYSVAPKTERTAESDEVLVSANHPTLGPLYWVYTSNADCNYPDHYTITDWSEVATRFPHYWREHEHLHWVYRGHIGKVFNSDDRFGDYAEVEDEETFETLEQSLSGMLAGLQAKSGQTVNEFVIWISKADWVDIPAPAREILDF